MLQSDVIRNRLLAVVTFIIVIAALRWSYEVTMPLVVTLFIVAAAWPIKPWLEKILPESLSYAGTILVLFLILVGFFLVIYLAAAQLAGTFAENQERFRSIYNSYAEWATGKGLPVPGGDNGYDNLVAIARAVFWDVYTVVGYLGIIAILVIMGLPEVPAFAKKLREQFDAWENREMIDTIDETAGKFRQYIGMTVLTSLITGVASMLWAFAMGLDLALMWGVLNFLLNFIPVIGNILGILPPTLYALIQFDDITTPIIVFVGYAALQIFISNVVYPMLQGRGMAMPPVAIIVALLFWGWLWGIVGALLAVPLTAALLIVCQHFKSTRWIANILARNE